VGTYYQQVSVRAITPECEFSYTFKKIDLSAEMTFKFIVLPDREPEVQGQLVALDTLNFVEAQSIDLNALEFATVRLVQQSDGSYQFKSPDQEYTCVTLENTNLGDFQ
jgi:hypothetical protein